MGVSAESEPRVLEIELQADKEKGKVNEERKKSIAYNGKISVRIDIPSKRFSDVTIAADNTGVHGCVCVCVCVCVCSFYTFA